MELSFILVSFFFAPFVRLINRTIRSVNDCFSIPRFAAAQFIQQGIFAVQEKSQQLTIGRRRSAHRPKSPERFSLGHVGAVIAHAQHSAHERVRIEEQPFVHHVRTGVVSTLSHLSISNLDFSSCFQESVRLRSNRAGLQSRNGRTVTETAPRERPGFDRY